MSNPYQVVIDFEAALCDYTGAKYAVTTTSCTMALLLALQWFKTKGWRMVSLPKRTYIGVPMSALNAGFEITWRDEEWVGYYQLEPTPVWDYARYLSNSMFCDGDMLCVSFHWTKILSIGQGGAILHDNDEADAFLRRARFDGRTESVPSSEDNPPTLGYHAYMSPRDAAEGLSRLAVLPADNDPLPWDDYPDLSQMEIFK